jgi:hypothetical protein
MTDYKQLCEELLQALEGEGYANWPGGPDGNPLIESARAALAESEPERLTVQQINDLPQHRENFIYSDSSWPGEIRLDGTFSRADLQQLADSIPVS